MAANQTIQKFMIIKPERPHQQYGSAIFVKASSVIEATSVSEDDNIKVLTVELNSVVVTSVYKPPAVNFNFPYSVPQVHNKPQIINGDFNSHSTQWGYKETNKDGEAVEERLDTNQLSLIHDTKLPSLFNSARWRRGYNPDLATVTSNISGLCQKIVMDPIPSSQHQPVGIQVNAAIKPISVPFKRCFNYKKADWKVFRDELEQKVKWIAPISCNYDRFAELVKKTARRHIPRGCRVEYIPGLSKESSELYEEYVTMFEEDPFSDETTEAGEKVMESISQERRKTWNVLIESTDMSKNIKKAWATIRKLHGDPKAPPVQPKVTANQFANQLLLNGKSGKMKNKIKFKLNHKKYSKDPSHTRPMTMEEQEKVISTLKPGKAIGLDNISTEQIKNFAPEQRNGYSSCTTTT